MSEQDDIREGLIGMGCPPDMADTIARWDERQDEIRERLLRLSEIDGPVVIPKAAP